MLDSAGLTSIVENLQVVLSLNNDQKLSIDHGKEFADYRSIEQDYQIKAYFCHPYSPWERGSNECFNRRLRWFFRKRLILTR